MECLHRGHARDPVGPGIRPRRGPAHPHRDGQLADPRRPDSADSRAASRGPLDPVGTDDARQRARRQPPRVRRLRRAGLRLHEGRRRALARRRFPGRRERFRREVRPRLRLAPPSRRRPGSLQPSLRGRGHAVGHRRPRRSPAADEGRPGRRVRAGRGRGSRRHRRQRRRPGRHGELRGRHRQGSRGASRHLARRRRRGSAGRRPRPGARHERCARQRRPDRHLPADGGNRGLGTARRDAAAGGRHGRRARADAADDWRKQPGLLRAGRLEVRRGPEEGGAARPQRPLLRRDRGTVPVARALDALPRDVERRPQPRWHRVDRAAAAAADVRRQVAARSHRHAERPRRAQWLRRGSRVLVGLGAGPGLGGPGGRPRDGQRPAALEPGPAGCRRRPDGRGCWRRWRSERGAAVGQRPACRSGPVGDRWQPDRVGVGADGGVGLREAVAPVAPRRLRGRFGCRAQDRGPGGGLERRPAGGHLARRLRGGLQARRLGLRRPLRQQRLAAGTAQAGYQADLGQRRAHRRRRPPSASA